MSVSKSVFRKNIGCPRRFVDMIPGNMSSLFDEVSKNRNDLIVDVDTAQAKGSCANGEATQFMVEHSVGKRGATIDADKG